MDHEYNLLEFSWSTGTECILQITIDLGLPDRIGHPPQGCQDEKQVGHVGVGGPLKEHNDAKNVEDGAAHKDGHPPHVLDEVAEGGGAEGVNHTVGDEDVAHVAHTQFA